MHPVATIWFFYGLSGIAIVSALMVITRRNPVHSAISLVFTLLSVAGLYLMLYAPFVAGVQIILYAGGIMVLFLFVIMLVNIGRAEKEKQFNKQWIVSLLAAVVTGLLFVWILTKSPLLRQIAQKAPMQLSEASNTQDVGNLLYGQYMLSFEIASLLLLVAIVGAVVMAKKRI